MKIVLIIICCTAGVLIYYLHYYNKINWFNDRSRDVSKVIKDNSNKKNKENEYRVTEINNKSVEIEKEWQMPGKLKEISGLAFMDGNRFACVQDELGIIFIYNTANEQIEQEIPFGDPGDYEGITIAGSAAYVVTSNGKITEVKNFRNESPSIKTYTTSLTEDENVEGLCYDKKNNRLLLALKDKDTNSGDYKGIYGFNLTEKQLMKEAVYKIDLHNDLFSKGRKKKSKSSINPSGISLHPQTGAIYIVDGKNAQLLIVDSNSNIKSLTSLQGPSFSQPEGITFNPKGELFISNEGKSNSGNILKVKIFAN